MSQRALLYLALNRWDGPRQRTQHLAEGLSRTRPVVFVEPAAYSLPGALWHRQAGEPSVPWRAHAREVGQGLVVYTPAPTLPGSLHIRSVNRLVHLLAERGLARLLASLGAPEVDVIVGWPAALDLARRLRPRRLIYDCLDLFPAFQHGSRRRLMNALEAELERDAWAVVVTSRALERRWTGRHPRVVRIPNGVELDRFLPGAEPAAAPPDLASLPRPRLGYIGTVGPWVDLPLLSRLAHRRPECSVVLIGPVERGVARPAGPRNLHFLGERPYATIPSYLHGMDVLLIPFRLTDLTQAVNPIKLYEYCVSGKPIAATPIEEVVATGVLRHLAAPGDPFLSAVDAALREAAQPDPLRVAARQALACAASWERRVAALTSLIEAPG